MYDLSVSATLPREPFQIDVRVTLDDDVLMEGPMTVPPCRLFPEFPQFCSTGLFLLEFNP